ncbi:MAG: acetylornithine deacetylase [Microlunatus sp.]|nr:acetylornithine deacetylase [Microlunatus sp.]MDN5770918.1 acetylornithine deacetylase [Microlunatus sp.]
MEPASLPWITRLISLDTTSRDSNLELIEMVAEELRGHGIEPTLFPTEDGRKANLVATVPAADGSRAGGVVLSGHTDVVPVDGQSWSSDPFTPEIRDGRLYGRGTCDMKSFIGVAMHLLPRMVDASLREPIHLALTYDEEVGCIGGDAIVRQIPELGLTPRLCFVGEPSSMRVIRAHKAINLLEVTVHGVAAHSSLTPQGANAIHYAAELIGYVHGLARRWRDQGPYDDRYRVAYTTTGVNLIEGGNAGNTVPARCTLQLEFRALSAVDPAEVIAGIRAEAAEIEKRMQREQPTARVEIRELSAVPGLDTATDSAAAALAVELGGHASDDKVTYGTEAGQFAGIGVDTVVCGPGDIAQAHAPDEFVDLDQIEQCERFVAALVDHLSAEPESPR